MIISHVMIIADSDCVLMLFWWKFGGLWDIRSLVRYSGQQSTFEINFISRSIHVFCLLYKILPDYYYLMFGNMKFISRVEKNISFVWLTREISLSTLEINNLFPGMIPSRFCGQINACMIII